MQAMMVRLIDSLPPPVRRRLPQAQLLLLVQLAQFATVGLAGFATNTAVLYATRAWLGLYAGEVLAYVISATCTWWLNRIWTFAAVTHTGPRHHQWMRFVVANIPGAILNLGTYALLIALVPLCREVPVYAIFAGAVAGMGANFMLSRALVFR